MKKVIVIILSMFLINSAFSQSINFNPRTGDVDMDGFLQEVNNKAKEDRGNFVKDVTEKFGITKGKIDELLNIMTPGDVFMAAQTAQIINKPIETVADTYNKHKDKGWGQIAKELGIKPGSAEFHEMKKRMKGNKGNGKGKEKEHGNGKGKKK